VKVGDDVRVVVSLGAPERAIPALVGLTLASAESRLQVSGFRNVVIVGVPESTDGTPMDRADLVVLSQDPSPARRSLPDVEVTLVVGAG
jgi:beta-lactam-binding protein with PASTA domain